MSNRIYNPLLCLAKQEVMLHGNFVVGATGAVGTVKGVSSVVRNSTGNYTITLEDHYDYFLGATGGFVAAVGGGSGSGVCKTEICDTPATFQANFKSTKQFTIQCYDYAGAAVDPAAGSVHSFTVIVRRSTVGPY